MTHSAFLQSFLKETPQKSIRMIAARGLAPIPPDEMLLLLVHLTRDPDQEVVAQAKETLAGWSEKEILVQIQSEKCDTGILQYFASIGSPLAVHEAIVLNPSTPGEIVAEISKKAPASLLETILYNRVRLLEFPSILKNIKVNPLITPQIQVVVEQIESEFFAGKKHEYAVGKAEPREAAPEEAPTLEFELPPDDLSLEGLPLDPEEREAALYQRIAAMTVQQKIQLARMGPREARTILIRDSNKEVARSVLSSPKLSEHEVEIFSSMRNISEDVLRHIGNSKEWAKSYKVALNLVKNPKTPPLISQRMLFRLRTKDLALVVRDRGLPEAVRRSVQRTLTQRMAKQQIK